MDNIACPLGCRQTDRQRSTYAYDTPADQPPLARCRELEVM